jgi:hypothetical protein
MDIFKALSISPYVMVIRENIIKYEELMKDCLNEDGAFKQDTATKCYHTAYYRFMGKQELLKEFLEALE